jgi:hypothetical protein
LYDCLSVEDIPEMVPLAPKTRGKKRAAPEKDSGVEGDESKYVKTLPL